MSYEPQGQYTTFELTDSSGTALSQDSQMAGMYIETATGAETVYLYLPVFADNNYEITTFKFAAGAAVTLGLDLELLQQGTTNWQVVPAYQTEIFAADGSSQYMNTAHPLRDFIPAGNQARIAVLMGGAGDVGVQATGMML